MAIYNSDIIFPDNSGQVRAIHGDLTLRANEAGGGDIIVGSGDSLRPEVDNATDLGEQDLRWKNLHATSGNFLERPSVTGADGETSGLLLQRENFYTQISAVVLLTTGISDLNFVNDGVGHITQGIPAVQSIVQLYPYFSIMAQHGHASAPTDWVLLLRRDGVPHASGFFRWNPNIFQNAITWKQWDTRFDDPVFMSGSIVNEGIGAYALDIHNDGSGTVIDSIAARVTVGWTTFSNSDEGL